MINPLLKKEILGQLDRLDAEQQQRVLDFTRRLAMIKPLGVSGKALLPFAGTIEAEDLQIMAQAIEEGCETINLHEW